MTNANPERLLCRTFLMAEYGRWLDPAISGYVPISACNNVAYRRAALEPYWNRLDRLCEAEYVLHRDMQAAGARVWLAADAKLAHENWTRLWHGVRASSDMVNGWSPSGRHRGGPNVNREMWETGAPCPPSFRAIE